MPESVADRGVCPHFTNVETSCSVCEELAAARVTIAELGASIREKQAEIDRLRMAVPGRLFTGLPES